MIDGRFFSSHEAAIPCNFAGSILEIHILCDESSDANCTIHNIARGVISQLAFAGGGPRPNNNFGLNDPLKIAASNMDLISRNIKTLRIRLPVYNPPGDLIPNTSAGNLGGSKDNNVYGPIVFPTDLTATAQTVVFRIDKNCLNEETQQGDSCVVDGVKIKRDAIGVWRDNFCENRGKENRLFMCAFGHGHAGQDVWGRWDGQAGVHPLYSVVDGVAFRRFPTQPAVTISDIDVSNIDYVYRHMRPSILKAHKIAESQPTIVKRGCEIALVDQLERVVNNQLEHVANNQTLLNDSGASYRPTAVHLHFEIRVPTVSGFQYVSPYQTIVVANQNAIAGLRGYVGRKSCN